MTPIVLIHFGAPVSGGLRRRCFWMVAARSTLAKSRHPSRRNFRAKQQTSQILQSLQTAADTVRSCIEQHTECIRTIQAELNESTATEPAIITQLAESIIESNGLVQHQCNDLRATITEKRKEIRDCLAGSQGLLFTFAALDRQQQAYNQVLASLEVLAAELASDIKGHSQRLQKISGRSRRQRRSNGCRRGRCRHEDPGRDRRRAKANRRHRATNHESGRKRPDAGDSDARRPAYFAFPIARPLKRSSNARQCKAAARRSPPSS